MRLFLAGVLMALGAFLMLAIPGLCQTSQKNPTFEVASVKAVNNSFGGRSLPVFFADNFLFRGGPGSQDPGRINYTGVTMRMLLARAYSLRFDQIAGPSWIDQQHYQLVANVPAGSDDQRVRLMLRSLLTERFQMQLHRESKVMSIYALVAAKGGPKLKPAGKPQEPAEPKKEADREHEAQARFAARKPGEQHFQAAGASVADFINHISIYLDQPVLDRTQLQGKFAFDLSYFHRPPGQDANNDVPPGPSLFEAVKAQLGLELIATKAEVELLFIDKATRLPADN
jgi:uncharacterized protein (TIGR03435 family)